MKEYKFCPFCGSGLMDIKLENIIRRTCEECGFIHYIDSKPCVAVLVEKNSCLMLVRRAIDPFRGWWDLPGGFLENGEHPEAGAIRELIEETGLRIEIVGLLGIHMDSYGDEGKKTLNFHYLARPVGGIESPASDVSEIGWFERERIPENIAFENCRTAVEKWRSSAPQENLPES